MTRKITFAIAAFLFAGAHANYTNSGVAYNADLNCTSCIRGGWNYCLYNSGSPSATITS